MEDDADIRRIDAALSELMRLTMSPRVHEARARASGVQLSRANFRLLSTVADSGPISVSRLAALLDVSQPTASRSLLQLEEEGLLARAGDPADRRVVVYAATPAGRRTRQRLRDHMRRQLAASLASMTDARRRSLANLLEDLVGRLYSAGASAGSTGTARRAVSRR
ncbi:MAG TPA: MarR family transcriptional regulator [Mycobacteriales bacterium]|nr:MarR family transcriptional regulator [Mycobacteriales bacterium]